MRLYINKVTQIFGTMPVYESRNNIPQKPTIIGSQQLIFVSRVNRLIDELMLI